MQNSPGANTQEKLQNGNQRIMLLVAVSELCTPMRSRKRPGWSQGYISEPADSQPRSETADLPPSGGSMEGDGRSSFGLKVNKIPSYSGIYYLWFGMFPSIHFLCLRKKLLLLLLLHTLFYHLIFHLITLKHEHLLGDVCIYCIRFQICKILAVPEFIKHLPALPMDICFQLLLL